MGNKTRIMALRTVAVIFGGTAVGSILPEFGNLISKASGQEPHSLNIVFCAIGIVGVGVALTLGHFKRGE